MTNQINSIQTGVTLEQKRQICSDLTAYVQRVGSANKASKMLRNVSGAYISHVMKGEQGGKWDIISDDMWRNIQKQVSQSYEGEWKIVSTENYEVMQQLFEDARQFANVFGIVGNAGIGKTASALADGSENTYLVRCNEYFNRKSFLQELMRSMGRDDVGVNIQAMMDDVVSYLQRQDHPVILLDEVDKLSDAVLHFFISLYNALEGKCGFVLFGAPYLQKRIEQGAQKNKKGYKEILSRVGGRFIVLSKPKPADVRAIVMANGVTNDLEVQRIINDADGDLRRVKRLVHAELRRGGVL